MARSKSGGNATAHPATVDVEGLNSALAQLLEVFPDLDRGVGRQTLLTTPDDKPRLEAAVQELVDAPRDNWLAGGVEPLEPWEQFRTEAYKTLVSKVLRQEFSKLKKSTINAVLAENNHDYARSRASLSDIASRSWRVSVLSFFSSWRPIPAVDGGGVPSTGCAELDAEIDTVRNGARRKAQIEADAKLARALNEEEYHDADGGAAFECECCFGSDLAWEDVCFCANLHVFCRECLRRTVSEAVYGGQGSRGLDVDKASVRCISSTSSDGDVPCTATVPPSHLPHILPPELMSALDDHFARAALATLDKSNGIFLLRCPFCTYATVSLAGDYYYGFRWDGTWLGVFVAAWVWIWWGLASGLPADVRHELDKVAVRHHRRPWETILRCLNPRCLRSSCLQCVREWRGIHDCARDEADSKRAHVARRMDEALKRTCPKCQTSFVKDGGCNRMRCICGYKMCYLCRADITDEGYDHFCRHFRLIPGTACRECERCSLFQNESEDLVLREANARAEREWELHRGGNMARLQSPEDLPGGRLRGWQSTLFYIWCFCSGYST